MMKKIIYMTGVMLAALASSCSTYDDAPVRDRIDELNAEAERLEKYAVELNDDILAVRTFFLAAENGDVIKSCEPLEDGSGYRIVFAEAGELVLRNGIDMEDGDWKDGEPGRAPVVGVKRDEAGRLYWTLDGEGLTDIDGNFVYLTVVADSGVDGTVPQLRVKDGMWQVTYNGNLWLDLTPSTAEVPAGGMYWFTDVEESDEYYTFTLRSSEKVKVSRLQPIDLVIIGGEDVTVVGGLTSFVDYVVNGMTSRTKVYAISNCDLQVSVQEGEDGTGRILFKAPADVVDGSVLVYADNGFGSTSMRMFVFKSGQPDIIGIEGFDPMEDFDWGIVQ